MNIITERLILMCAIIFAAFWLALPIFAVEQKPLQEFMLKEHFGVNHADQVVVFELKRKTDTDQCHLLDDTSKEVPFQLVSGSENGSIAFCTDLPANTTKTFRLMEGRGPKALDGVKVDDRNPNYIEITNGLTGVRVPKVYNPLTTTPKAPIQGVQFRDGTWSPAGTALSFVNDNNEGGVTSVDSMMVTVKENGPVRAVIEVKYNITSPECRYGALLVRPEGPAHYTTTVTLERGQPSVLIETDTDLYSSFSFSLYDSLRPTQLRYCGHHATEIRYGRIEDGSIYPLSHARPNMDALVDLDYTNPVEVGYGTGENSRSWMALWNPWAVNSGWYWQMYDAGGETDSNLMGIFAGAPSRLIGAGSSSVGIYSRPGPDAGVTVLTNLRGGNNTLYFNNSKRTIRFAWGIFAGTKADAPARLTDVPTIKKQWILHGNGVNLQKLVRWKLDYPDPDPPFGAMYMPRSAIEAMIQRIRTDDVYYQTCYNNDPYNRDIFDMWRDSTGAKAHAMAEQLHHDMRGLVDDWTNGHGYKSVKYSTQPWLIPPSKVDRYDQVLSSGFLTPEEKARMKAGIALFANWLWDDDQYPFQSGDNGEFLAMVNMGNPNMPGQWVGARSTYTWFIASHPEMAPRLKQSAPGLWMINDFGASNACPHYANTFTPNHNVVMQRKMLGYKDWETEPKLVRFAEWYLNMMTLADVRYGGVRSVIVDGDSQPCDPACLLGEMGTACAESHPVLSRRLMWMWNANGKRHSGFYSSTHLRISEDLPTLDPQLGNASFPGYGVALRSAWNTPQETSIHAFNGSWYRDHRRSNTIAIYALGAPLALNWESMYNPYFSAQYINNGIVIPESNLGINWNADFTALDITGAPWNWDSETQEMFADFSQSGIARYHTATAVENPDLIWTRSVYSIHPDADYPLIYIKDDFSGARANDSMTLTLTLMADGTVETCAGSITPKEAFWDVNGTKQFPSGGQAHLMPVGLNKFSFTGQQFGKAGETPAIDWDIYSLSKDRKEFCIGRWGHNNAGPAGWYFQQANGSSYEQRQHILHIKGTGGFTTLLVPRRKGAQAPDVKQEDNTLRASMKDEILLLSADGYSYAETGKAVVTAFGSAPVIGHDLSVEGGPTEVVQDQKSGTITVTAHGTSGKRFIGVPAGQWQSQNKALVWNSELEKWTLDYNGGKPGEVKHVTVVLKEIQF